MMSPTYSSPLHLFKEATDVSKRSNLEITES